MSLIALTSTGQNPSIFASNYPQPIPLPTKAQVCLQKFIHFRDDTYFNITDSTNTLYFVLGNTQFDGKRKVVIDTGEYRASDLANEISIKMNAQLQQQNYEWRCDWVAPSAGEEYGKFTIAYSSVNAPAPSGGDWTPEGTDVVIVNNDSAGLLSTLQFTEPAPTSFTQCKVPRGVLVHEGNLEVQDISYDADAGTAYTFGETTIGMVRNVISSFNLNNNLSFNPAIQDVGIKLRDDIQISVAQQNTGVPVGAPNWIAGVLKRTIPNTVHQQWWSAGMNPQMVRFKFNIVLTQVSKRALITVEVSETQPPLYNAVPDGTGGNDTNGNPYVATKTVDGINYQGVIWDSADANFQDNQTAVQNLIQTKRCPYLPTISFEGDTQTASQYALDSVTNWQNPNTSADFTMNAYTGTNGFEYTLIRVSDGQDWYLFPTVDLGVFDVWNTDVDPNTNPNDGTFTQNTAGDATSSWQLSAINAPIAPQGSITYITDFNVLKAGGVFNQYDRPVGLGGESTLAEHQRLEIESNRGQSPDDDLKVGADMSKTSGLWLRALNADDVANNGGAPLYLTRVSEASGNIGLTIGSNRNVVTALTSTGQDIFESDQKPQQTAKDNTLHISINEFPNVKSYEGGKSNIGKSLAIIPREEFSSGEDNGSLVYVANFENWVDMNNKEMAINQLSMEVRRPDGTIATDLRPDTYAVIKIRQDPTERELQAKQEQFDMLAEKLASAVQSGQILSQDLEQRGAQLGS